MEKNFWETWMKHLPCVGLHYPDPELSCNWVALDDRCRSHMAVSYLYSLGHRRIGFLSNECGEYVSRLRYQGFLDALRYFSLPCREEWQCLWQRPRINGELLLEPPFEVPDYEPHLRKVFQKTDFPTALVCLDDWRAYCANAALKKMGFSIPEDVSVIGGACTESQFTSDISFTRMIDQVDNICEEAAKLLLDVMHSPPGTPPKTWLLRPRLVTGKTTAPPRRDSEGNPLHTHRKDNQ